MMKSPRFWIIAVLLVATAVLVHARDSFEVIPKSEPLAQMPAVLDGRTGTDVPLDQETLDVLGAGDFLSRIYAQDGQSAPIGLFIGYFPSQRTGVTIHSPKHCLPGAGWSFESSSYVDLSDAGGKPHHVGEYIISNGESRQFVIYWYQAHGRSVANEYMAKVYMVADAMRMNRTDGALAETFTAQLMPMLSRYIPD
jgi:EpsI family protein